MKLYSIIQSLYILGDIGFYSYNLKCMVNSFKSDVISENSKIILLGDNFYPDGILSTDDEQWNQYQNLFQDIPYKNINSVMGNHDYHGNPSYQIQSNYLNNNKLYFMQSFENIDLYFLDTVLLYKGFCYINEDRIKSIFDRSHIELKSEQLSWFEENLTLSKSHNRKIVVFGHYPILSNGYYYNDLNPLYKTLMPLFEKYKIDAYISGHEHNIQYIKRNINDYVFHQLIVGCSSENRQNEFKNEFHNDMFENDDNYYLKLYVLNNKIICEFKNKRNEIKHSYII